MAFLFEKLVVYKKSMDFAAEVRALIKDLPTGNRDVSEQLKRAAISIPANIAEGNGRWHAKDKKQFLRISRGSVFECVPLIELLQMSEAISEAKRDVLRQTLEELSKMLSSLIASTREIEINK